MLLIGLDADHNIALRRAPDLRQACTEAWGAADAPSVASLRELLGLNGAHEWRLKGIEVPAVGGRIHPHYGVFAPTRGEYVGLVADAPLPPALAAVGTAFDVGTGTGVLAAVLARRGVPQVVATDQDPRALACARENLARLGVAGRVFGIKCGIGFPEEKGIHAEEKTEADQGGNKNPEDRFFLSGGIFVMSGGGLHQFLRAMEFFRRGSRSGQSGASPRRLRNVAASVQPMATRQAKSSQLS
jgi:predicted nicotinamide N-methyase